MYYSIKQWGRISTIIFLLVCCMTIKSTFAQSSSQGYYTGDKIPGDSANEVTVLKNIYKYIKIYRQRHDGKYPGTATGPNALSSDILNNFTSYNLKDATEYNRALVNPDNEYSDLPVVRKYPGMAIISTFPVLRRDGTELGSPHLKGTRDLLSSTNLYVHWNYSIPGEARKLSNPVGFYMVLWDDGIIQKVDYDQVFYISIETSEGIGYSAVFPSEAGLPWNCLSYAEFMSVMHAHTDTKLPLIGYPLAPGQIDPKPDNGGIESLVTLTRLFDHQYDREQIWDSLGHQVKNFTLQEVMDGAAKIDFPLQKKTITLDELQKLHTPAMLYLSDTGRIVTMSTIDDNHAIIYDRGMTLNVSRAELAKRYSGEALIAASVNAPSSLTADQPIRTVNFPDTDTSNTQNVDITNHGTKPVSLLIERPLCGITEASLSQDTVAPGASVLLHLELKWRTVLPGDHQSTFVTLKTDDPAQPRLQLGFDLKLAEAAK